MPFALRAGLDVLLFKLRGSSSFSSSSPPSSASTSAYPSWTVGNLTSLFNSEEGSLFHTDQPQQSSGFLCFDLQQNCSLNIYSFFSISSLLETLPYSCLIRPVHRLEHDSYVLSTFTKKLKTKRLECSNIPSPS